MADYKVGIGSVTIEATGLSLAEFQSLQEFVKVTFIDENPEPMDSILKIPQSRADNILNALVRRGNAGDNKINDIKFVRSLCEGLSLKDSKDFVEKHFSYPNYGLNSSAWTR